MIYLILIPHLWILYSFLTYIFPEIYMPTAISGLAYPSNGYEYDFIIGPLYFLYAFISIVIILLNDKYKFRAVITTIFILFLCFLVLFGKMIKENRELGVVSDTSQKCANFKFKLQSLETSPNPNNQNEMVVDYKINFQELPNTCGSELLLKIQLGTSNIPQTDSITLKVKNNRMAEFTTTDKDISYDFKTETLSGQFKYDDISLYKPENPDQIIISIRNWENTSKYSNLEIFKTSLKL